MKLVWCPETASKAYIDAVTALADRNLEEINVAELVSAMAGGWKAQLIVEAWARDAGAATSVGLRAAAKHGRGRHVCVVPGEQSAAEYVDAMRRAGAAVEAESESVVVGEAEEVMRELEGVDLMVVDCRRRDAGRVLREARPGPRGMVVVCTGAGPRRGGAAAALGAGTRVVRSTYLPVGSGVEVLHVGVGKGPSLGGGGARWIRHVDRDTKEEHVFRRR
ncbi:hypothetical protein MUK42_18279 [Musa troglodytarum]|uniref:Uncharacterized protein n=1 Tax=Musa troglodytarum TaxID=320322 RepID=A0A9E7KXL2_9LILI|nr:hypothetical protein MUK42_18279 [Musa troglodytarum]